MKQFQVPQFITVEDRVIGPFTAKQFLYLAGGAGVIIASRLFLPAFFSVPVSAAAGAFAIALAYLKIKGQPFPTIVKNAFLFAFRPRLYVWRHEKQKGKTGPTPHTPAESTLRATPKLSESRLADLAWSLNIKDKFREAEEQE